MSKTLMTYRRELHQIPELGFDLYQTSEYIENELIQMGYQPKRMAKTGWVIHKEGKSKEAILFRTDMDALPVKEETNVSFVSNHEGKMHACGHDGHMAMMLGFASYVSKQNDLNYTVVMIFQPAEEGPGGAKVMIEEGLFDLYDIKACYGIHLYPGLDEGIYGLVSGPMMAQNGEFDIMVKGKSSHGGQPHLGDDAIIASSALIQGFQTIVSRRVNPLDSVVITVGKISGGQARNIVAQEVKLSGTMRAFKPDVYKSVKEWMKQFSEGIEMQYNVKIDHQMLDYYPAVVNDPKLVDHLKSSLNGNQYQVIEPMTVSEDFAFYQQKVPGVFVMLGSRNESKGYHYPLHSCYFNFDENILDKGVELYIHLLKLHQAL